MGSDWEVDTVTDEKVDMNSDWKVVDMGPDLGATGLEVDTLADWEVGMQTGLEVDTGLDWGTGMTSDREVDIRTDLEAGIRTGSVVGSRTDWVVGKGPD
mmetsp:Transcript_34637/g.56679  ORF Transcript_34637/g.56679 Transcript_34637/m.56679 type:complete len:99 (+) Transcript_34637:113-409(+)